MTRKPASRSTDPPSAEDLNCLPHRRGPWRAAAYLATALAIGALVLVGLALLGWLFFVGPSLGEDDARAVLRGAELRDVQLGPAAANRCDDIRSRSFAATNRDGRRVTGVVCCGWWGCGKACTVRLDP